MTKKIYRQKYSGWLNALFVLTLTVAMPVKLAAQARYLVNLTQIDGINLTPDNIFNFSVQQSGTTTRTNAVVRGVLRYRNSQLSLSYHFRTSLGNGTNTFNAGMINPQWQFSNADLQDLFLNHKTLPAGIYEYCVSILPDATAGEVTQDDYTECLYHTSDESFLINLIDPEDKARLREHNPVLSWIANYSASTMLTYRIRIADIKHGQNAVNAVMRNQPIYTESNLAANSIVYPQFAKPLVSGQRYAWTVDAFYKSLLLGGSETWEFVIVDDKPVDAQPVTRSYIDIRLEKGTTKIFAAGELKLKYVLDDLKKDTLFLEVIDRKNVVENSRHGEAVQYGDNRFTFNLQEKMALKHMHDYSLVVKSKSGKYTLSFTYLNPELIKQ